MNENKLLGTKSKQIFNALKLLVTPFFSRFVKQLKEHDKLKSDDAENELLKYIELNNAKLTNMVIKEFKDELKNLKTIINKMEKLEIIRKQEINEIINQRKRRFNQLNDEIIDILVNLEF